MQTHTHTHTFLSPGLLTKCLPKPELGHVKSRSRNLNESLFVRDAGVPTKGLTCCAMMLTSALAFFITILGNTDHQVWKLLLCLIRCFMMNIKDYSDGTTGCWSCQHLPIAS